MNWRKLKVARWLRDKLRSIRTSYKYSPWSPRQIRYAIKNKFITKPNKVHVKYFSDWDWTDKSDLVRHLPFVVLVDFIENEDPYTHFDTEDSPHAEGWKELKELYEWYKNRQFEFDAFDYMNEKLGYERTFGSKMIPLERGGVDAWGDPKMYSMENIKQTALEQAMFHEAIRVESEKDEEFTRKACRVLELYGHLWT
jgi:hypothetical protein